MNQLNNPPHYQSVRGIMKKSFVGIAIFDETDTTGERTWDFVEQLPSGGAGHTGHLSSLAEQVAFGRREFTLTETPPEDNPGRGLIVRWYVPLPKEWQIKFMELYEKEKNKLANPQNNKSGGSDE